MTTVVTCRGIIPLQTFMREPIWDWLDAVFWFFIDVFFPFGSWRSRNVGMVEWTPGRWVVDLSMNAKASGSRVEQTYSRSGVYMMRLDASYETLHNANQILLNRGTVRVKSVVPDTRTFKYGFEWCSIACQKLFSSYNRNSNKKNCLWSSRQKKDNEIFWRYVLARQLFKYYLGWSVCPSDNTVLILNCCCVFILTNMNDI